MFIVIPYVTLLANHSVECFLANPACVVNREFVGNGQQSTEPRLQHPDRFLIPEAFNFAAFGSPGVLAAASRCERE
jgi:hypothetical protein